MIRFNPDPHTGGYVYVPKGAVTALFPTGEDPQPALRALAEAGFADERVDVYTGEQGATVLDADGQRHGLWVRFKRSMEEVFTDDAEVLHRADRVLRAGGSMIAAFTHGDKILRERAVEILRNHGGREPIYWGSWATEYF